MRPFSCTPLPFALTPLLSIVLASCSLIPAVGPDYTAPEMTTLDAWKEGSTQAALDTAALAHWWQQLNDRTLDQLIERALLNNQDLTVARSRVNQSRSQVTVIGSRFLPDIGLGGAFNRRGVSDNSFSISGNSGTGEVTRTGSFKDPINTYEAGLDATWELDIFGGTRRAYEAASAQVEARTADLHDVQITLIAEVARRFADMRAFQRRLAIAESNLALQSDTLELVQFRYQAGLVSELDVVQAKAQLETSRSQVPTNQLGVVEATNRLAVLCGTTSSALSSTFPSILTAGSLPEAPKLPPSGLPSETLRQRPDIQRAERTLAASSASIGVAVSDLFPKFNFPAGIGYQSITSSNWFDPNSLYWSITPGVQLPLFNAGRLLAQVDISEEQAKQSLAIYERTVLAAIEDTDNALTRFSRAQQRTESLDKAFQANRRAMELSKELYRQGLVDFLRVLEAQRATFFAEDQLLQSRTEIVQAIIAVYKAFGGGWQEQVKEPGVLAPVPSAIEPLAQPGGLT